MGGLDSLLVLPEKEEEDEDRTRRRSRTLERLCKDTSEGTVDKPGGRPSTEPNHVKVLISDFPPPDPWENKCLGFKPPAYGILFHNLSF
jgi:hypothetical protein